MQIVRKIRKAFQHALVMPVMLDAQLAIQHYRTYALQAENYGVDPRNRVIVSLTTYNKRIFDVYLTIESLLQQTVKPARLLLWLSEEEFITADLPLVLKKQQQRGLEIRFCKDIRSFKKLVPTLNEVSGQTIITVDDDYIYPFDFIERLMVAHRKFPECVCYYMGSRISFKKDGGICTYSKWVQDEKEYSPSCLNFATGAGGILYPAGCFHSDVVDVSLFSRYAPCADDVWFKAMTLMNDVRYVKIPLECDFFRKFILLDGGQDIGLYHDNVEQGKNDRQIKAVFDHYKLFDKLKNID